MEHNKDSTPVASQPVDATAPTHDLTSTTPAETTRSVAIPATEDQVQTTASDAVPPPQYERNEKEVTPAPETAVLNLETYPPHEKTAWQSATQAPAPQPGQGLVVQRAVELNQLNEEPRLIICPFCYQEAMTRVQKESTSATGMAAVGCCLIGGICLAFLPFCMEMCHDCHHFCTKCGQKVAIRPHDGPVQLFAPHPPVVATAPEPVKAPEPVAMTQGPSEKN
ncbi:hypothetical protein N7481_013005 [Penicillium waksmanii]|uniref:uncharacterized protein n=1 Tax=Penicillium waksmanii TaxID=69791 RepID=UPI002547061C|nr:uncharacterized protein N7481_013005 [Penicillium waksmanii]KAJ5966291.1 hypothetical protein N7481_013005 [Penicillium waksmanii]